jgi:hypothetical protein
MEASQDSNYALYVRPRNIFFSPFQANYAVHIMNDRTCALFYFQNFFTGITYFGNFFYLPIYFQSVLGYNALISGALLLPLVIASSVTSIIGGQIMSRIGRYKIITIVGFALLVIGGGMKLIYARNTTIGLIIGAGIVEGMGFGLTLPTSEFP